MTHRIFITGAAGYIGGMLCDVLARRTDVERIVALDKEPMPEPLRGHPTLRCIKANTADASWRAAVAAERPDVVIHAAWQIREMYGQGALQRAWNIEGTGAVADFAFATPSVKRLVHFSTVASYGAQAGNSIDHLFREDEQFRACDFRYADEKRIAEASLERKFAQARGRGSDVAVVVLRPAAVTGPRGRARGAQMLQAALSGQARTRGIGRLVSRLVAFVPVTPKWCRQFVHEDDVADVTALAAFGPANGYEAFNVCPGGDVLRGEDLAKAFGKRAVRVHPQLIRLAFFLLWHGSHGRICTPRGAWKSYAYTVAVDGAKLSDRYAFQYRMGSCDALTCDTGRYAAQPAFDKDALTAAAQVRA